MEPSVVALIGLAAWPVVLVLWLGLFRTMVTTSGKKKANEFSPAGDDVSPFSARLCRAHANCYEFLPFVLALLLYAVATDQTAVTDGLALIMLAARLAQSIIHIISTSVAFVTLRFVAFVVQLGIVFYWAYVFLMGAL